jgi:subtilase family serine protease
VFSSLPPYTPAQIKHAYTFDRSISGKAGLTLKNSIVGDGWGETIAIVDAYVDPFIRSDVDTFDKGFAMSQYDSRSFYNFYGPSTRWLTVANPQGASFWPDPSWTRETALDVEWAHAIAPGAKVLLVEAKSPQQEDMLGAALFAASQPGVKVVSMSWGSDTPPDYQFLWDASFQAFSSQGITFVASAGDHPWDVSYPATSPSVLSVGGTSLTLNNDNTYASEQRWLLSGLFADVSYDADPNTGYYVFDTLSGGWREVGGTSAGAPQWAALIAIADQGRALNGLGSLGTNQMKTAVYHTLPASDFHLGNQYNLQTGWGTPIANKIIPDLASGKYV